MLLAILRAGLFVHLLRLVGMRKSTAHKRAPTLLDEPSVQVLIGKVTYGDRSSINVNAAGFAVDFSAPDVRRKFIACINPASPMSTVCPQWN
jgi:hypothetical protein